MPHPLELIRRVRETARLHPTAVLGPCVHAVACLGLLVVTALRVESGTPDAAQVVARPGPLVIAHRGFSSRAPENTLPSFKLALAAKADLVELDYHLTRDGTLVVLHDSTLDRTTDATNRWGGRSISVGSRDARQLEELDAGRWFRPSFAGTRVPTLVQALETIQASGCTLIESKVGPADALIRLLRERECLGAVVVQSFNWEFVRQAHALAPELVVATLGPPSHQAGRKLSDSEKQLSPAFVDEMMQTGARILVWNRQVDEAAVRLAHQRGCRVWVYTIDDPTEAARIVGLGVDGIITNDPEAVRRRLATGQRPDVRPR